MALDRHSERQSAMLDTAIEVGRERNALREEMIELRNRHGLLREALAAVRVGEAGPLEAREALVRDAELAPDGEYYESQPPAREETT